MSYKSFRDAVIRHMSKYNDGKKGVYRNSKTGKVDERSHVLDIPDGKTKEDVIKEMLERDGLCVDMFTKPQRYAHHLNSSQIVCYEFFRPLLDHDGRVNELLLDFLQSNKIQVPDSNIKGQFEYTPDSREYTNFDFYLQGELSKVYFEVKYTENGFGSCKEDDTHRDKFEDIYKPMIESCGCLSRNPTREEFCKHYQLFRNVLRVTRENGKNEFSIFVFPSRNTTCEKHFDQFKKEFISGQLADHVVAIHWEDCVRYMSHQFKEKFFYYV